MASIRSGIGEFQSTLPREERRELLHLDFQQRNFNPRSHERSDVLRLKLLVYLIVFQSTLPREERHRFRKSWDVPLDISIHAPTRGATNIHSAVCCFRCISIHAPTRGATAILHKKFVYFYTIPTINI